MLSDREREALCEIERQLLKDPRLARCFGQTRQSSPPEQHHRIGAITTIAVGLALCAALVVGPRPPTDAEVVTRATAGPRWIAAQIWEHEHRTARTPFVDACPHHLAAPVPSSRREKPQGQRDGPSRYHLPTPWRCAPHLRVRYLDDITSEGANDDAGPTVCDDFRAQESNYGL